MEACIISNNAPLRVSVYVSSNIFDESNEVFGVHSICLSLNFIKLLLWECNYEKHRKRVIIQFYKTLSPIFDHPLCLLYFEQTENSSRKICSTFASSSFIWTIDDSKNFLTFCVVIVFFSILLRLLKPIMKLLL